MSAPRSSGGTLETRVFGAIDIGASAGRVMAGVFEDGQVDLHAVHRFPNRTVELEGSLRWDVEALYHEVLTGLWNLGRAFPHIESIGIDTWAVDYGVLDETGELWDMPIAHRDDRTGDAVAAVHARMGAEELYARHGLQHRPSTTLYQLAADRADGRLARATQIILLPDLLASWLSGVRRTELTNASTTGMLDVTTGRWSRELMALAGLDPGWFPPLVPPGVVIGTLREELCAKLGVHPTTAITTVGSHDTASAVAAVPASGPFAYLSTGTRSLVGVETAAPVVTDRSWESSFTNEAGIDGRTRLSRCVGGLRLLEECLRVWGDVDLEPLLDAAARLPAGGPTVDVDDPTFELPGEIPARIAAAVDGPMTEPVAVVRCILDSLALTYARTVTQAERLISIDVETVHVVGHGSRNALLCQLTADATRLPVVAGPVEATALGNVLVQARTHGVAPDTLEQMRAVVARSTPLTRYLPRSDVAS